MKMINGGLRTHKITKKTTDEKPLISVVTVVYNGEETLEQTIQSVVNQTYDNIEYIIVDGGSKDGTLDIIKRYEDKIDYWQSESDKGIYDAMNKGIELATGDYICLLNADDWFENYVCEKISQEINKKRFDVYYAIARVINNAGEIYDIHGSTINIINRCSIAHQTAFISKKIYSEYKYDTNYRSAADYEFFCRLSRDKKTFRFIDTIFVNYRLDGMSDSNFGQIETYKIKYKYGYISFMKYLVHFITLKLSIIRGGK